MHDDENLEQQLAALPVRGMDPAREALLLSAVRDAEMGRHRTWWRQGIPLWQAAAACLIVAVLTGAAARIRVGPEGTPVTQPSALAGAAQRPSTRVVVETPLFRRPAISSDIGQWVPLSHSKGS